MLGSLTVEVAMVVVMASCDRTNPSQVSSILVKDSPFSSMSIVYGIVLIIFSCDVTRKNGRSINYDSAAVAHP